MEPPAKVTKFEMESQYLEGEVMEEGQEEWLSEGILTDDDYNPASQEAQADHSDSNVVSSQDESMNTGSADDSQNQLDVSSQNMDTSASNIEDTLNNLENTEICNLTSDLPEELNAFLIRKVDGKVIGSVAPKKESDVDESVKQSDDDDDDDGNDTDDLLRVLGDGDQSSKHIKKEKVMIKTEHGDFSDGDDSFIFGGGDTLRKVNSINVAKTVLSRAPATKAEPEDDDPTDCSSDEADTVKKMFTYSKNKGASVTPQISTTVKPGNLTITPLQVKEQPKKMFVKKVVNVPVVPKTTMPEKLIEVKRENPPRRQYVNKRAAQGTSILKQNAAAQQLKTPQQKNMRDGELLDDEKMEQDVTENPKENKSKPKIMLPEVMDEDVSQKPKDNKLKQKMMCPEVMDEDVPTDGDSESDEESLYSELPSSESDSEDWFTLDIRNERAGDYIPLLGDSAYQILSEERNRVKTRLDTLKRSLKALSDSGRELADQLKDATNTVAELDAMLKAA